MPDALLFNVGGVLVIGGLAWKLSRDITTLQITIAFLTTRIDALELAVRSLQGGPAGD